jgi:hypothetical protein
MRIDRIDSTHFWPFTLLWVVVAHDLAKFRNKLLLHVDLQPEN